jgi:DNA-directed RNA polymerase omega subunit
MEQTAITSVDHIQNRFLFVMLVARRALQLQKGARARVETGSKKPIVVSMAEVLEDKVQFQLPDGSKQKAISH